MYSKLRERKSICLNLKLEMQWLVKTVQNLQRSGPFEHAGHKFSTAKTVIPSSDSTLLDKPGGTTQFSVPEWDVFLFLKGGNVYEKNA